MPYKRNQVEEAISRIFAPKCESRLPNCAPVSSGCLTLTVLSVGSLGQKMRNRPTLDFLARRHPGPEPLFRFQIDAFALLNGLRIMEHGWPQGFAVLIMRRLRLDLEKEHARILRQDPHELFDQEAILARASPGAIAVDNTDPVFLTVASKAQRASDGGPTGPLSAVCRGLGRVDEFRRDVDASSVTMFEVATLAHRLHEELMKSAEASRPRSASFGCSPFSLRNPTYSLNEMPLPLKN